MKSHAFKFASWNMIIAFLISWGIWKLLAITAFEWGWIDINDGFIITLIFTFSSFIRVYFTNLWQLNRLKEQNAQETIGRDNIQNSQVL